jgi:hypothetical protein
MRAMKNSAMMIVLLVTVSAAVAHQSNDHHPAQLLPDRHILWTDPGDPSAFDFTYGTGG